MKYIYRKDQVELDPSRITSGTHPIFGDTTIFHDAVIASEMVQVYDDGAALKSRDELELYVQTMEFSNAVVIGAHPVYGIVSDRDEIAGRTINHRFVKDLIDPKTERPSRAGVRADIEIFNKKVAPEVLSDMKNGKKSEVSVGFFHAKDETPGEFDGVAYDYIQCSMLHNHLAAGIDNARCPDPYCGLGADEIKERIAGDPFAGFKDFAECEKEIKKKNPKLSDERVKKICGSLKAKSEEKKDIMVKASKLLRVLLEDEVEALKGENDAKEKKEWWELLDWSEDDMREVYDTLAEDLQDQIIDAGLCPDCESDNIATDMSLEEIDAKLKELKEQRDALRERARAIQDKLYTEPPAEKKRKSELREQVNQLWDEMGDLSDEIHAYTEAKSIKIVQGALTDQEREYVEFIVPHLAEDAVLSSKQKRALPDSAYAYIEKGCKKEDGKTEQKCRHFLIHDPAHVRAALAALKGARTGKIPAFAKQAKAKICSAAKKFKIASEVCGTVKKKKEDAVKKLDAYEVLKKAEAVLRKTGGA